MLALCAATAVVVVGLLVATALPEPSGPYPVGTTTMTLRRAAAPGAPAGTFDLTLWYPGEPASDRAPYDADGPGLARRVYHRLVRTHAARDVALAPNGDRFPLLIYVAGWGGDGGTNTVLATDLASHGYVVGALADTIFDRPPAARLIGNPDFSTARAFASTTSLARRKIDAEALRATAVLDLLAALDRSDPAHRFTNRLDLGRIGIFGFSLGGAAAVEACNRLPRCAGALNLDGYLWSVRKERRFPYFVIMDLGPWPSTTVPPSSDPVVYYSGLLDADDGVAQRAMLASGGYMLQVAGTTHLNFTDVPLFAPLQRLRSTIVPARAASIVDQYALAFFDTTVKGRPSSLLTAAGKHASDVSFSAWPISDPPVRPPAPR